MRRRVLIVANPAAGRGRALAVARTAAKLLPPRGHDVELATTRGPGHAAELAARAVATDLTHVLVCGGDGTVGECAAGLARSALGLGILPCGRGNDLAAALGLPADPARALDAFLGGTERRIDLGTANGRPFCTVVGLGLDGSVAERVRAGLWRLLGGGAYAAGALASLFTYRAGTVRLTGDFGDRTGRFLLIAVSNTGRYGGGIAIVPDARPDDGLLDCCLVHDLPWWRRLRIFPTVFGGGHLRFAGVELHRAGSFTVESDPPAAVVVDGEPSGRTPVTFGVAPLALRVVVPRKAS